MKLFLATKKIRFDKRAASVVLVIADPLTIAITIAAAFVLAEITILLAVFASIKVCRNRSK